MCKMCAHFAQNWVGEEEKESASPQPQSGAKCALIILHIFECESYFVHVFGRFKPVLHIFERESHFVHVFLIE